MQGKNIVKFFLILLGVVCLIQYLFIIPTSRVEREAETFAQSAATGMAEGDDRDLAVKTARAAFLDSVSSEVVFSIPMVKDYTYEELKSQQLALGLDLKGGMSVILQVDLRGFLETLSGGNKNVAFQAALEAASVRQRNSTSDYITLFADEYGKQTGKEPLANIFIRNPSFKEKINHESSDNAVLNVVREMAGETVDLTFKRLKDRIDKFGVTQPNVSLDANRGLIVIELPGIDNPERARRYLQASAKLEFWDVYRISDAGIASSILEADKLLGKTTNGASADTDATGGSTMRLDSSYTYVTDSLGQVVDSTLEVREVPVDDAALAGGPLTSLLELNNPSQTQGWLASPAVIGFAEKNKMRLVSDYLNKPEVKRLFPSDLIFRWSAKPVKDVNSGKYTNRYELYALRKKKGADGAGLEGDRVVNASAQPDPISGQVTVSLKMDNAGARIWNDMTSRAASDNNREIAIMLDDEVVSAPRVNNAIPSGDSQITGNFTIQEAKDLANILQVGKLPAKTKIIQESLVGPSLGQDNIRSSIISLVGGFILLLGFMVFYYGSGGFVSILALFANVFFILGVLASYGTVLTLPGIAGIVLTIGMAVDSNVIVFERIKEEMAEGKSLATAISDGFKNAYSSIIDANVTSLLTAIVLAYFGLGPIKGFAVVLIIGVLSTMFTAILVARLMIDWWITRGGTLSFYTNLSKNIFKSPKVDWIGKRKLYYTISSVVLLAGFVSMATRGFELGVDFKGGYSYNIVFDNSQEINLDAVRDQLAESFGTTPVVKAVDTRNTYNIVTSYMINEEGDDVQEKVHAKLYEGINKVVGGNLNYDQFKASDGRGTHISTFSKVGPTVAQDIKTSSVYATVFSILIIFIYILIRFTKWQYSVSTLIGLVHDCLLILSVFSLFHGVLPFSMEIDQAFIAALLTILGYSMNDTVVVFDRIREFMGTYSNRNTKDVLNLAINQTLNRTVITAFTTILVVLLLFIFGGSSIKGFAFALVIGIVIGTYSSICVSTPLMYDIKGDLGRKQPVTVQEKGAKPATRV